MEKKKQQYVWMIGYLLLASYCFLQGNTYFEHLMRYDDPIYKRDKMVQKAVEAVLLSYDASKEGLSPLLSGIGEMAKQLGAFTGFFDMTKGLFQKKKSDLQKELHLIRKRVWRGDLVVCSKYILCFTVSPFLYVYYSFIAPQQENDINVRRALPSDNLPLI